MFGERLREARTAKGLTQSELGRLVGGVGKTTISQYENGIRKPDIETLERLADVLNRSVDWLLGRTDIEKQLTTGPLAAHHDGPKGEDLSDLEDIIADAVKKAAKWREEKQKK